MGEAPALSPAGTPGGQASPRFSVSVVICAYAERRFEALREAVTSVAAQARPADQLVVVIDHNAALLQRAVDAFPTATVI